MLAVQLLTSGIGSCSLRPPDDNCKGPVGADVEVRDLVGGELNAARPKPIKDLRAVAHPAGGADEHVVGRRITREYLSRRARNNA